MCMLIKSEKLVSDDALALPKSSSLRQRKNTPYAACFFVALEEIENARINGGSREPTKLITFIFRF